MSELPRSSNQEIKYTAEASNFCESLLKAFVKFVIFLQWVYKDLCGSAMVCTGFVRVLEVPWWFHDVPQWFCSGFTHFWVSMMVLWCSVIVYAGYVRFWDSVIVLCWFNEVLWGSLMVSWGIYCEVLRWFRDGFISFFLRFYCGFAWISHGICIRADNINLWLTL